MAGILDWLSQLINGRPQAGPQQTPGATPTVGGLTGQGGPFAQPGSILQTLGVPMAILGSVEAARGKPVGAAYLEGIGGLLGDIGQQRSQFATQSNTANALEKELEQRFPQFAKDKGLQQTIQGVIQNDPSAALRNIEGLQRYFESQTKANKLEEKTVGGVPYMFDPRTGAMTKIPGTFPAAETTGKPSFELAAWAKANHKDLNNLTPQDMQQWQQYKSDPTIARMLKAQSIHMDELAKIWQHQDAIRDAKDVKTKATEQAKAAKDIQTQVNQLAREGRTTMARAKDPKFPQAQLSALVDSYNDSVENLNDRISAISGDLPSNWKRPTLKKLQLNPAPGGGWLSWVPYVGSKFPVHGTVESSGDID